MKLPKQWSHWLRKNKMKDTSPKSFAKNSTWFGHGRYWRTNCFGEFQASCKLYERMEMINYWEKQISLLKQEGTPELDRSIAKAEAFLKEQEPKKFKEFENYLAHMRCEYAERIGKSK